MNGLNNFAGLKYFVTDHLEAKGMLGLPGNLLGNLLTYEEALLPYFGLKTEKAIWDCARAYWKELEASRLEDPELVNNLVAKTGCDLMQAMVRIGLEKVIILLEAENKASE